MEKIEGNISEWNEGNFKSFRLHYAQSLINTSKIDSLKFDLESKRYNFQVWITAITILYDEGSSKYDEKEIQEVDRVKKLIETLLKVAPPFRRQLIEDLSGKRVSDKLIDENWEYLKDIIELYERLVKRYNDKHGLSTKNRGHKGLFG